jgi:MOSC domain-containing protein YiiM
MQVISVNLGRIRETTWKGKVFKTAIFKEPACGPVQIATLGLEGDQQANTTNHGGILKALFAYPFEHYTEFWELALAGTPLAYGSFGENLTTQGWMDHRIHVGDTYRLGRALVVITIPRKPYFKLNARLGRDDVLPKYLESKRTGFYLSVVEPGVVAAGDSIELVATHPLKVTPSDLVNLYLGHTVDPGLRDRALKLEVLTQPMRDLLNQRFERFTSHSEEESAEF